MGVLWEEAAKAKRIKGTEGKHTVVVPIKLPYDDIDAEVKLSDYLAAGYELVSDDPAVVGTANHAIVAIDENVFNEAQQARFDESLRRVNQHTPSRLTGAHDVSAEVRAGTPVRIRSDELEDGSATEALGAALSERPEPDGM